MSSVASWVNKQRYTCQNKNLFKIMAKPLPDLHHVCKQNTLILLEVFDIHSLGGFQLGFNNV